MTWIWYAMLGHLLNGGAFIVDKLLLQTTFKRPATYAISLSLLSAVFVLGLPFVTITSVSWTVWLVTIGYGVTFVLALAAFFEALKKGSSTSVIPLTGTGIPILTLIAAFVFAGETLTQSQYIGFAILILSAILLTIQTDKRKSDAHTILMSFISIILFATSNVLGKIAFLSWPFLTVFILSRLASCGTGLVLYLLDPQAQQEIKSIFIQRRLQKNITGTTRIMLLLGQAGGALGFLLVNLALSQGHAGLVTALQATQYALIACIGWFGGARIAKLLGEDVRLAAKLRKTVAFVGIAIGLWFTTR